MGREKERIAKRLEKNPVVECNSLYCIGFKFSSNEQNSYPSSARVSKSIGRAFKVAFFPTPSCINTTGWSKLPTFVQTFSRIFSVVVRLLPSPELTFQS